MAAAPEWTASPQHSCPLRTSGYDLVWEEGLCRNGELSSNEVVPDEGGPPPMTGVFMR